MTINREPDPVRTQTSPESLDKIDQTIESKIRFYANQSPETISKRIRDLIDGVYDADEAHATLRAAKDEARYERMSEKELAREIKRLEKDMVAHARNLEFEKAAEARDQLHELRKRVFGVEIASD